MTPLPTPAKLLSDADWLAANSSGIYRRGLDCAAALRQFASLIEDAENIKSGDVVIVACKAFYSDRWDRISDAAKESACLWMADALLAVYPVLIASIQHLALMTKREE